MNLVLAATGLASPIFTASEEAGVVTVTIGDPATIEASTYSLFAHIELLYTGSGLRAGWLHRKISVVVAEAA
ncbi:MAG TPA: hypothetical protein VJU02_01490 [Nitrospiraceae bacterium]|nr:hypothetical protein [Nitrospiraceae bacterium]